MTQQQPADINIPQLIYQLERRELEALHPPLLELHGALSVPFLRVLGQAAFWEADPEAGYEQRMEDLVTGLHGQGLIFHYLVHGAQDGVHLYVGLCRQDAQVDAANAERLLAPALIGSFPGIELADKPDANLGALLKQLGLLAYRGQLTGIPTRKTGQAGRPRTPKKPERAGELGQLSEPGAQQIERLIRALAGAQWGFFVRATPYSHQDVINASIQCQQQIGLAASKSKLQIQVLEQTSYNISPTQTSSTSQSKGAEIVHREADYAVELLESHLSRLDRAKAQGMWQTDVHFFAGDESTQRRLSALVRAVFAGEESRPEPVRTYLCSPAGRDPNRFFTLLTSAEVATLSQLPRVEFPGYRVCDYARFDVDPIRPNPARPAPDLNIGRILDGSQPTGGWFVVDRTDLVKHGLVVGVTGSGKTNTLFYLLEKLRTVHPPLPFLVIEPAKAEYRELRGVQALADLQVFTLGDEMVSPFRLNPFEFEIGPTARIHVQTHIDYLKSVFNAAFVLYAPMPYVLETCLHEVYVDKGWDLTTGQNRRLPVGLRGQESKYPVFPTLTDLYLKIDEVVDRLGYEERIQMDVKAGLKARIGSLRLGGKGLMLDVPRGLPIADLLGRPVVLEMERVGNDDEKAFLIGLILTRLYEYRVLQARSGQSLPRLQHVTVVEEAHRLLKNVPTEVDTESANTKGQAVETFSNMLSEIRAYGQGVLIAEQIPTKLAPDAIKNTNLKVMHRVVAEDDREVMGGTMNMRPEQERYVTTLATGQAVVYAEGADKPYLVAVPAYKGQRVKTRPTDADVAAAMRSLTQSPLYDPAPGYSDYMQRIQAGEGQGRFDPEVRDMALQAMAQRTFPELWAAYTLSMVSGPANAVWGYGPSKTTSYQGFPALIQQAAGKISEAELQQAATALMLYAAAQTLNARGRAYGWLYNVTESLRAEWVKGLVGVVRGYRDDDAARQALASQTAALLAQHFLPGYKQVTSLTQAPLGGCTGCLAVCLYRDEVALLVRDKAIRRDFSANIQNKQGDALWSGLAGIARMVAHRLVCPWLNEEQKKAPALQALMQAVAHCYVAQMGDALEFSTTNQHKMAENVGVVLRRG